MDKKRLIPIFLIIFTNILGAMSILPILPLYAEGEFNATVVQVALIATLFFGAQFLAAPVLGRLSDRFGRRPLLIISQIGTVISFLMFAYASEIGSWLDNLGLSLSITSGLFVIFSARLLDGITGGNITIAQAYVADVSTQEERTRALGLLQAALGSGIIFGPVFGGLLATISPTTPFFGAAIITFITLLLTIVLLDESLPPEKRHTPENQHEKLSLIQILSHPTFILLPIIGFIHFLTWSALPATFTLYASRLTFRHIEDPKQISLFVGLLFTFFGLFLVVFQIFAIKPLVKRLGERKLILIGQVLYMLGNFLFPIFSSVGWILFVFIIWAFARGITNPSMQSLVTRFSTDQTRGQLLGIFQSSNSLGLIFGPLLSGYIFASISPQAVFYVGGIIMTIAVATAYIFSTREIEQISLS